jgi:hypothetical protein
MYDAIAGKAAQHDPCAGSRSLSGIGVGRSRGFRWVRRRLEGWRCGLAGSLGPLHATVHRLVGQPVGVLVLVPKGVGDLEGIQAGDPVLSLLP